MFGAPVLGDAMLGAPVLGAPMLGALILGAPILGAPILGAPVHGAPMLGAPMLGAPVHGDPMIGAPMLVAPVLGVPILGAHTLGAPMLSAPAWCSRWVLRPLGAPARSNNVFSFVTGTTMQSSMAGPFVALAAVRSMGSTGQFEQSGRMTMERTMRLEPAKWARVA